MVKDLKDIYGRARAAARGSDRDLNPHVDTPLFGAFRHVYVADTDNQADEIATPAYTAYYENLMKLWRDFNTVNTLFTPKLAEAKSYDVAWSGSPKTVAAEINKYFEESGTNYVVLAVAWGSLTAEQARRSFDLLTNEVMPLVV
ncbi:MAG: hypothetical protein HQ511_04915 [Rhodospirillales bacterium]|nr:hypothetical protein [Rhodospirillales bacterium]